MTRPPFKPTAVQRRKVAVAAGAGMSHEEIALGLGIARNTLSKHFEVELSSGACSRRLDVLDAMWSAARKGNVAAQKAYVAMTPKLSAPGMGKSDAKPAAGAPEGKKAAANAAAIGAQAGTGWEDLLPGAPLQ